jgi:DNA-binding transcriptional ArsR family regulator
VKFSKLDPLLHSELRLAIMSLLISVEEANFNYLLDQTGATRGNVSVQLQKLKQAGYIEIQKEFRNNYPLTTARITKEGQDAFELYVKSLQSYLKAGA